METKVQDRLFWREYFQENSFKKLSHQVKWPALNDKAQVEKLVGNYNFKGKVILSGCCGVGWFERLLLDREPTIGEIIGLDLSPEAIKTAEAGKPYPGLRFIVGDMERLPFPDGYFDTCLIVSGLHHIPSYQKVLGEARRVSRDLILIEPNALNPIRRLVEWRMASKVVETSFYRWGLVRPLSLLGYSNIKALSIVYVGWFPNWVPRKVMGLKRLIEGLPGVRDILGGHLIIARRAQ